MKELETRINDIVRTLLNDYEQGRVIDEVKSFDHPDKDVVVEILYSIRKIIFPGYFRNKSYRAQQHLHAHRGHNIQAYPPDIHSSPL